MPSVLLPQADVISTVEFNHTGELLATGDKGGRVVIFQREPEVCVWKGHEGGRKRMGRWLEAEEDAGWGEGEGGEGRVG